MAPPFPQRFFRYVEFGLGVSGQHFHAVRSQFQTGVVAAFDPADAAAAFKGFDVFHHLYAPSPIWI